MTVGWVQERTGELEVLALQIGQIVAEVDGTLHPSEVQVLRSIQGEIEHHLRPLRIDQPATSGQRTIRSPLPARPEVAPAVQSEMSSAELADLTAVLSQLDCLIGLANIKQELRTLVNVIRLQQKRRHSGLPVTRLNSVTGGWYETSLKTPSATWLTALPVFPNCRENSCAGSTRRTFHSPDCGRVTYNQFGNP